MIEILVIDDHPSVAEGLRSLFRATFRELHFDTAASCERAVQLAASRRWSLIVSDLSLPGRSGHELIAELARVSPESRILVYSVSSERQFGVRALRAGAHGYITKDKPLEQFLTAVHTLLNGKRYISHDLAEELAAALVAPAAPDQLSDREMQVLRLVGRGLSPAEIGQELHISPKTVSTYRSRILEKLRLNSTADLIRFVIEHEIT